MVPVGIGNPHAVLFADTLAVELTPAALEQLGPGVAMHPALAHGANVQLARAAPPAALDILIWERGVGPTTASGTSACATAAAAVATGRLEPGKIEVRMPGGSVRVRVSRELDVVLRGWFYLTPVIIPFEHIPERMQPFFKLNPMYYLLEMFDAPSETHRGPVGVDNTILHGRECGEAGRDCQRTSQHGLTATESPQGTES